MEKQVSVTYPDRSDRVIDGYTHFYNTAVSIQYKSVYIYISGNFKSKQISDLKIV